MPIATDALPDDPAALKAMLLAERIRSERLVQIIKELQRHRFGRRAETLPEGQLLLALEDIEQSEANAEAAADDKAPAERVARQTAPDEPWVTAGAFAAHRSGRRSRG